MIEPVGDRAERDLFVVQSLRLRRQLTKVRFETLNLLCEASKVLFAGRHRGESALGVGHPQSVVDCTRMGYYIFDCAMPTRDARHARLYTFTSPESRFQAGEQWFTYLYVNDDRYIKSDEPVSPYCDCLCCQHYSRGYLHYLFKINDSLFFRLATIHNLRFMTTLTQRIQQNRRASQSSSDTATME